jgi:hypothetical protein
MNMKVILSALALGAIAAQAGEVYARRERQEEQGDQVLIREFTLMEEYISMAAWSVAKGTDAIERLKARFEATHERNTILVRWSKLSQVTAMLKKCGEWEKSARETKSAPFEKELATISQAPVEKTYFFRWDGKSARLHPSRLNGEDCAALLALLRAELPAAKKELDEKRAREAALPK